MTNSQGLRLKLYQAGQCKACLHILILNMLQLIYFEFYCVTHTLFNDENDNHV